MADFDAETDVFDLSGNGKGVALNVYPEPGVSGIVTVTTFAALPPVGIENTLYVTEDDGQTYIWDDTAGEYTSVAGGSADDSAYGPLWNGNADPPTKNAVFDEMELRLPSLPYPSYPGWKYINVADGVALKSPTGDAEFNITTPSATDLAFIINASDDGNFYYEFGSDMAEGGIVYLETSHPLWLSYTPLIGDNSDPVATIADGVLTIDATLAGQLTFAIGGTATGAIVGSPDMYVMAKNSIILGNYDTEATWATVSAAGINIPAGKQFTINGVPVGGGGGGLPNGDLGDVVSASGGASLTVESATPAGGVFTVTGNQTLKATGIYAQQFWKDSAGVTKNIMWGGAVGFYIDSDGIVLENLAANKVYCDLSADYMGFNFDGTNRLEITATGITVKGSAQFGTNVPAATSNPLGVKLGGTFSDVAGDNPKIELFYNGTTTKYGFGVSNNQLDYMAPTGASHAFYIAGALAARLTATGFTIPDEAYGAPWDGKLEAASKNAVYDKIQAVIATIPAPTTSIVGITGTIAQFNAACTDADFITTTSADSVTNAMLADMAALTVKANATNAAANPTDVAAANDGEVLRRSGTALAFGTIATAGIANSAVTFAKLQKSTAGNSMLANPTATAVADFQELFLAANTVVARGSSGNMSALSIGAGLAASSTEIHAKPNIQAAGSESITPTFLNDVVSRVAIAGAVTINAASGTAIDGWGIVLRLKAAGVQTIGWNAIYRAIGVTLPTATVAGKMLYIGMIYNTGDTKWDVVSVAQEA